MKNKVLMVAGVAVLLVTSSFAHNFTKSTQTQKSMENIVLIEYTYECEDCGYNLAEGYFSYVDNFGYEECKDCGKYTEIKESRVDVKK